MTIIDLQRKNLHCYENGEVREKAKYWHDTLSSKMEIMSCPKRKQ